MDDGVSSYLKGWAKDEEIFRSYLPEQYTRPWLPIYDDLPEGSEIYVPYDPTEEQLTYGLFDTREFLELVEIQNIVAPESFDKYKLDRPFDYIAENWVVLRNSDYEHLLDDSVLRFLLSVYQQHRQHERLILLTSMPLAGEVCDLLVEHRIGETVAIFETEEVGVGNWKSKWKFTPESVLAEELVCYGNQFIQARDQIPEHRRARFADWFDRTFPR
ncbi:hypothetical protein AB0X98_07780 [Rothia koreensis]|uniref:hypothetical protein n=1 Tax=Rothia koreensis TaxID=592378 RepID=UPI003F23BD74